MQTAARVTLPTARLLLDLLTGLALRGGGAAASFVVTWLIARQFGAAVVGQYQIALTTATLGAVVATLGLHLVLVREAAKLIGEEDFASLSATYKACRRYVIAAGCVIAAAIMTGALIIGRTALADSPVTSFVLTFTPLVLFFAWLRLNSELLRSLGDVWRSQAFEGIFYTGLTALILMALWLGNVTYSPSVVPVIYLASVALSLALSALVIGRKLAGRGNGVARIGKTDGLVAVAPAIIMPAADWTILLFVGIFLSIDDAGVFRTVVMYAALIQMVTASFAVMAGPHLAKARASHDRARFFSSVNAASLVGVAVASPLVLAALFIPDIILGWFGPDFLRGADAMAILAIGQIVGVAAGPAAPALMMLHREKQVLYSEMSISLASIPLAYVLVQEGGLIGPALAILAASVLRAGYTRWALRRAWPIG